MAERPIQVRQGRRPNGLTVVHEAHPDAEVAAVQLWIHAGSTSEEAGAIGAAHLQEHMLFRGTEGYADGEVPRLIERRGGRINAWTTPDDTVLDIVLPARQAALAVEVLARLARAPTYPAEALEQEKRVVLREIAEKEGDPWSRDRDALMKLAFAGSGYARPLRGDRSSVEGIDRDALLRFHRRWYTPDNATLVVVGGISSDRLEALCREHLDGWAAGAPALGSLAPTPPSIAAPSARTAPREPGGRGRFAIGWPAKGRAQEPSVVAALRVRLLSGDGESGLARLGDAEPGFARGEARLSASRERGLLVVRGATPPGRALHGLGLALMLVDELRRGDLWLSRVADAYERTLVEQALARESFRVRARELAYCARGHLDPSPGAGLEVDPVGLRAALAAPLRAAPVVVVRDADVDVREVEGVVRVAWPSSSIASTPPRGPVPSDALAIRRVEGRSIIVERTDGPLVEVRVCARAGRVIEAPENAGAGIVAVNALAAATPRGLGFELRGYAGAELAGLRVSALPSHLDRAVDVVLDLWLHGVPSRAALLDCAAQVRRLGASVSSTDDATGRLLRAVYGGHPYGRRSWDVGALEPPALLAHLEQMRRAPGLTVLVSGPVRPVELADLLEARLASAPTPTSDPEPTLTPAAPAATIRAAYAGDRVPWMIGGPGRGLREEDKLELDVLIEVLAGHSGWLFRELRERRSLVYSISAEHDSHRCGGALHCGFEVARERLQEARGRTRELLAALSSEALSEEAVATAKQALLGQQRRQLQRRSVRATTMAFHEALGLGHDAHRRYAARMEAVTVASCRGAARALRPEALTELEPMETELGT